LKIQMSGIRDIGIEIREKFSPSKEKLIRILEKYKNLNGVCGAVMISTCNRTEVYISVNENYSYNVSEILCNFFEQDYSKYEEYFFEKEEEIAFEHLCLVGSGLQSQIFGDDQIITQVREALEYSRLHEFTDGFLETFFRIAISSAKEIKTKVILKDQRDNSAPYKAILKLKELCNLENQNILVIGNGQMGRLASELLIKEKSNVVTTLREYRKGIVQIPNGVSTIPYTNRYEVVEQATIVISATTSLHHTIRYEDIIKLRSIPQIIVDLAVPRDIDPMIKALDINLLTIDDLGDKDQKLSSEIIQTIDRVVDTHTTKYYKWVDYKRRMIKL